MTATSPSFRLKGGCTRRVATLPPSAQRLQLRARRALALARRRQRLPTLTWPLAQVEYAFKAMKGVARTTLAVRGADSVCVVTQKKVPDKLLDPASVTHVHAITRSIGMCTTGVAPDARQLVQQARTHAADFRFKFGYECPVDYLAKTLADPFQARTSTTRPPRGAGATRKQRANPKAAAAALARACRPDPARRRAVRPAPAPLRARG